MLEQNQSTTIQVPPRFLPQVRSTAHLLIAFGILELIYGQWSAPSGQINFRITLLAVGIALYFGSATVIAVIRWLALFSLVTVFAMPLQQVLLIPIDLTTTQLRLHPGLTIMYFAPLIVAALVIPVIASRLNSEMVKETLRAHGKNISGPLVPVVLGLLLMVGTTVFLRNTFEGADAARATEMAASKFGSKYKYFTNQINVVTKDGTTVYATVQMWNDNEALQVPVHWRR